jgi:hypothetical protein
MTVIKFLALVVVLNIVRYVVAGPLEAWLIFGPLSGAMEESAAYFNTSFTTFDWVTSFSYNFMMWLSITWLFFLAEPRLEGSYVVRSLKLYGVAWLFFASLSGVYMNHYSHPKDFYFFNVLDAAIVFPIVAVANGLLFPRFRLGRSREGR